MRVGGRAAYANRARMNMNLRLLRPILARSPAADAAAPIHTIRKSPMMRPLPIAASLALLLTAFAVTAQDPATTVEPATAPAAAEAQVAAAAPAGAPAAEAVPAAAPAAAAPALQGDATRGKGLTYTCRGCHGVTGYKNAYPNYHVPKLGGQSEAFLRNALMEYRTGHRKHPTMQAQAEGYSEQQIADIAAFLASIK